MELAEHHSLEDLRNLVSSRERISLSAASKERINKCHAYLINKVEKDGPPIYGINTGFGSLCNTEIDKKDLIQLQINLLRSHACGTGEFVPKKIVKLMLLLKAQSLSYGHSGVQLATVEKLLEFYNNDVIPVVYELGSLGASGDLAPLSHLALPLIGEGKIWEGDNQVDARKSNLKLGPKEGLALINGTQFMQAYGVQCLLKAKDILKRADLHAAMCFDAYEGRKDAFLAYSHQIRPHPGQINTAKSVLDYLEGSEILNQPKVHVQDPYSLRCVPQVHGASKDAIAHVEAVFETEINSVTDNPNVFPDEDLVLSAGNFHGQTLALQLDYMAIAIAEIGSIAERRIYRLVEGKRGLPAFLTSNPGLESGLMIAQYTAASIVSQNKQLCTPSSVDTIESSNGQEDHVSMGANAATKCLRVIENVERIQAIELLTASKALEYRRPLKSSKPVEELLAKVKNIADISDGDKVWADEAEKIRMHGL
ncbi:MAG: histidine ammonia-lyase [Bacteroidia bacterium]|nr:histidine ammonia-lyase [Bacteroidia bacterium]NNJ55226.1 histidine ammonia-lyase [Bacteroidia bacterium]